MPAASVSRFLAATQQVLVPEDRHVDSRRKCTRDFSIHPLASMTTIVTKKKEGETSVPRRWDKRRSFGAFRNNEKERFIIEKKKINKNI